LTLAKDADSDSFKYQYDTHFNLTSIRYDDGTSVLLEYEKDTMFVSTIKERYGEEKKYTYGSDADNPRDHYWTEVTETNFVDQEVVNRYEYWIQRDKNTGISFTKRKRTRINNIVSEVTYNRNGDVVSKSRGDKTNRFFYDADERVIRVVTSDNIKTIDYEENFGNIERVESLDKNTNETQWSLYVYDSKGDLQIASTSAGEKLEFTYWENIDNQIKSISAQDFSISIDYKDNKPSLITLAGVGSIQPKYEKNELVDLQSEGGFKVSLQVSSKLQEVLRIIEPAELDLNL
jgi:hypothetical protein